MKITYSKATQADVLEILKNLREADHTDFYSWGVPAEEVLPRIVHHSIHSVVGKVDGKVACLWGVMGASLLGTSGMLWMLTSNEADKATFRFARHSQMAIEELLKIYPKLWGYVSPEHERSKRWLRWLKFDLRGPVQVLNRQVMVFERTR